MSHLRVVAGAAEAVPTPPVRFCGHCAHRPAPEQTARICPSCQLGVVLEAHPALAPQPGEPFIVADDHLGICALSDAAGELLGRREEDVVNTPLAQLLEPADVTGTRAGNLAGILAGAAAAGELRELVVRPAGTFGVRFRARAGRCGLPPATLVVLSPLGRSSRLRPAD